jgi:hypothetical protein
MNRFYFMLRTASWWILWLKMAWDCLPELIITLCFEKKLDVFQQRCLQRILGVLGITYKDRITNTEVLQRCQTKTCSNLIRDRQRKWLGHLLRTLSHQPCNRALSWHPPGGRRNRGRPRISLRSTLEKDIQDMGLGSLTEAAMIAKNRPDWRSLVAQYSTRVGGPKC